MNNEPVAWMDYLEHSNLYDLNVSGRGIPLYTNPEKALTDEEIYQIIFQSGFDEDMFMRNLNNGVMPISLVLAKAILRKAQEK